MISSFPLFLLSLHPSLPPFLLVTRSCFAASVGLAPLSLCPNRALILFVCAHVLYACLWRLVLGLSFSLPCCFWKDTFYSFVFRIKFVYFVFGVVVVVGWVHMLWLVCGESEDNSKLVFLSSQCMCPWHWTPIFRLEGKYQNHLTGRILFVCVWGGCVSGGDGVDVWPEEGIKSQSWSYRHFTGCLAYYRCWSEIMIVWSHLCIPISSFESVSNWMRRASPASETSWPASSRDARVSDSRSGMLHSALLCFVSLPGFWDLTQVLSKGFTDWAISPFPFLPLPFPALQPGLILWARKTLNSGFLALTSVFLCSECVLLSLSKTRHANF